MIEELERLIIWAWRDQQSWILCVPGPADNPETTRAMVKAFLGVGLRAFKMKSFAYDRRILVRCHVQDRAVEKMLKRKAASAPGGSRHPINQLAFWF